MDKETARFPMTTVTETEFDFYDWAGLYKENPEEFEARRTALLMIEASRGTPAQAAACRAMLDAYEKRVAGCEPQKRLQVAASMMAESVSQLGIELKVLKHSLEQLDES